MDKFKDMTVEAALQTQATFKTDELVSILGRSSRSFHRWQGNQYSNPMPKPVFAAKSSQNLFDAGQLLAWYKSLPLRRKQMHSVKLFMMGITLIVIVVGVPFLLFGCANQPTICPELTVKFCPSK